MLLATTFDVVILLLEVCELRDREAVDCWVADALALKTLPPTTLDTDDEDEDAETDVVDVSNEPDRSLRPLSSSGNCDAKSQKSASDCPGSESVESDSLSRLDGVGPAALDSPLVPGVAEDGSPATLDVTAEDEFELGPFMTGGYGPPAFQCPMNVQDRDQRRERV